jgi:hypothetical protein
MLSDGPDSYFLQLAAQIQRNIMFQARTARWLDAVPGRRTSSPALEKSAARADGSPV